MGSSSDPAVRCLHMGDIIELGTSLLEAFAHPDEAEMRYLHSLGFLSFNEYRPFNDRVTILIQTGNQEFSLLCFLGRLSWQRFSVTGKLIPTWFGFRPTELRSRQNSSRQPTRFSTWARLNVPV